MISMTEIVEMARVALGEEETDEVLADYPELDHGAREAIIDRLCDCPMDPEDPARGALLHILLAWG